MSDQKPDVRIIDLEPVRDGARERLTLAQLRTRAAQGEVRLVLDADAEPKGTTGWVYTVDKINKTTVTLRRAGQTVRAEPWLLHPATAEQIAADEAVLAAEPTAGITEDLCTGMIVRVSGPGWKQDYDELYVITGFKGLTDVSLVRLGGNGGRTWPKIPRTCIVVVIAPNGLRDAMNADPRFRDL